MFQRKQESRKLGRRKLNPLQFGRGKWEGRKSAIKAESKTLRICGKKMSEFWPGTEIYVCKKMYSKETNPFDPLPPISFL